MLDACLPSPYLKSPLAMTLELTVEQFLQFALYALPAVLFWYFIFRFQNRKAMPTEIIRDTFFIGMFSVIPLFIYQHAYLEYAPFLCTQYLSTIFENTGIMTSIVQVIMAFAVIGIGFTLTIAGFSIFYSLFTKSSFKNTVKAMMSEPLNFSATSLIFILLLLIDLGLRSFTSWNLPPGIITSTFILAILEEFSKHLFVRLFDDHKIKSVANAIELSIVVGISFAFFENITYLARIPGGQENLIIGRSIISMFGHIVFSGVFGYYYGISKFAKEVHTLTSIESRLPAFPQWLYKVFRFKTENSFQAQKIFEGLVFATLIHFAFNMLLELGFTFAVIPILVGGGFLIYLMLNSDIAQKEFSIVGSKEMPEDDFEKLTWKISVMKHLRDIKQKHPDSSEEE
jgi:RsiW-degrading membrane proteinase PrsW (M82 family)